MNRVLLVTGSRVIADSPAALQLARAAIEKHGAAADAIVAGDARGPDALALGFARERGKRWAMYSLDGLVRRGHATPVRWNDPARDGDPPGFDDNRALRAAWCLTRDRAMVRDLVAARDGGRSVTVLAVIATWSKTHGAEYTAQRAEAHGITVLRAVVRATEAA